MRKWRIEDSEELYNVTGWGVEIKLYNKANPYIVFLFLFFQQFSIL